MLMVELIKESIQKFPERNALCIDNIFYTYNDLGRKISSIRELIRKNYLKRNENVGIVAYNDFETYASILALLLEGLCYVPINPTNPKSRFSYIIELADLRYVLTSRPEKAAGLVDSEKADVISVEGLPDTEIDMNTKKIHEEDNVYLIFTSGSTGLPKGAPINTKNINAYFDSIKTLGWEINENDSFLQMSSLSFDFSILSFLLPICLGACVYSVPEDDIRFLYAVDLLNKYQITVAAVVPSTLIHLRPYFNELLYEDMRYCLVAGEAFPAKVAQEWQKCVPNAEIINIYGPTESTVFISCYTWNKDGYHLNKMYHDIVAVGKIHKNVEAVVVDENFEPLSDGQEGELLITGPQLTTGYLKNPERNSYAFVDTIKGFEGKRFYRTGDLVIRDKDGFVLYIGRIDFQVKIQGHRVELGEIESHARDFTKLMNIVTTTSIDEKGNQELILILENYTGNIKELLDYLKSKMPVYMIPSKIHSIQKFPLNANGKTDRNKLVQMVNN